MHAGFGPTREKIIAVGWILLLTFGAMLIILTVCVYQWRLGNLRYAEFISREKPLSEALDAVYRKLMADQPAAATISANDSCIHPRDVRKALARGPEDLGELPPWVTGDGVYIARNDVPTVSGRFICFIKIDGNDLPYGLTSTGRCRNATAGEIFPQDFVALNPEEH
jgi:hypothetical protein